MSHPDLPDWLAPLDAALGDEARLREAVSIRPGVGGRPAAVLALIGSGSDGPEVLLVERARTLRSHPGQIAFPGGAADPDDVDLADTALREAVEETGLDRTGVEVLGRLPPAHVAVSGFDVTTVVGWWRMRSPVSVVDPQEAAAVLTVPVSVLTDPARRARVRHPSGYTGPAFEVDHHLVWGLTAHLLASVLELAGWERPWNRDRLLAVPARYLSDRRDEGGPNAH